MILFLDTNILIEFVEKRRYSEIVFTILDRCSKSDSHLYMSVGGFYTITYLIDRHLKQEGKEIIYTEGTSKKKIKHCKENDAKHNIMSEILKNIKYSIEKASEMS